MVNFRQESRPTGVGACHFLPVINLVFRQIYAFFILEPRSRRVVSFRGTSHPTDAWVAQQLREAMPFGHAPRFLSRDRDSKYGNDFARVAKASSLEALKTPCRAPKAKGSANGSWAVCGETASITC